MVKSLCTKLDAEVSVVSAPNSAYRSFKETVICCEASGKGSKHTCTLMIVRMLIMHVTDVDVGKDKW